MSEQKPTFFSAPAEFRAWLETHHATTDYLWVGYYKKATNKPSLTWEESVDEALCYGWIDGIRKSRDDESYMIRFTPRKTTSVWSQRNIDLVKRLTAEGRMKAAGLAAFAFKDVHAGSGYATADFGGALTDEMISRFKETAAAWEFYQAQPPGYRKQAVRWVTSAKRAVESTELVRERLGDDLFGFVIDAPEGGLACCGLVNVASRLPRPGASSHKMAYVQWVSTAPQHQRKGYAHLVMAALMKELKRLDIEVVERHASPQGLQLYEELGFFVKTDNIAMSHVRGAYAPQRP